MARAANLLDKTFGRLTVKAYAGLSKHSSRLWLCICDCGKETTIPTSALQSGNTTSCGCARYEALKKANVTHNASHTSEHNIWKSMKQRTTNPNCSTYHHYGGRGIEMCPEWLNDFGRFLADVGPRPSQQHSIDRINNDGNYEPSNIRWVTHNVQTKNRRSITKLQLEVTALRAKVVQYEAKFGALD